MNKSTRPFYLLLFFSFCNPLCTWSQNTRRPELQEFRIEHFTDEDGLPQNSVYAIAQDELGYMWLSTQRGLARFDGKNFKIFDDFGKTYSAAIIASFHIDPRPKPVGFFALNDDWEFIHVYQGKAVLDTTLHQYVRQQPFLYPRKHQGHIMERHPRLYYGNPYPNYAVYPVGDDRFFVFNGTTLEYYRQKKRVGRIGWADDVPWHFFRTGNSLYHLKNGKLNRFALDSTPFRSRPAILKGALANEALFWQGKYDMYWNNATEQTFIRVGPSLYRLTPERNGDLNSELILTGFDFGKEQINAIYYDFKAQRIFIGSQLSGLFVLTREKFSTHASPYPGTDQVYYGQTLLDKNTILSNQGIAYTADPSGNVTSRQVPLITSSVFWDKTSILKDQNGFIWCKRATTLMMLEPDASAIKFSWTLPSEISQLYQGPDRTIWIATRTKGLFFINAPVNANSQPTLFLQGPFTNISWVVEQPAGTIWVGTGQGLFRVARKTKQVSEVKGLEGIYIRSLYTSPNNTDLWITTYKDGFFLLRDGKLTHFPLDRKGYLANAHCIVEDRNGFFWIPTNRGLFQVLKKDLWDYADKPAELYYHHYSKTDGFNSNEFNGGCEPCAVRLPSGIVSLPSINGLVWFKPEQIPAEMPDKKIVIDRIEIDQKTLITPQKHISFLQSQKQLKIEVNTPFFGNDYNVEFSYALAERGSTPGAADWLGIDAPVANKATINISTLGKGHYTLYVRKMNGFGIGNYGYETLDIDVPPFWYETWWFYLSILIAAFLATFFYLKYRIRSVQRRSRLLELQISERTSQLQGTLRDLESSQNELLDQMHLQSRLMASIAHDVRSPLGAAIIVAGEMQKMIERQQFDMVSLFGKNIEDALRMVKGSLEDLLAYVKIQVYKHEPKSETVALHELLEENMQLYGKNTKINSNTFRNLIPVDTFIETHQQLLKIVIHNLIDNANKYTDNGEIRAYTAYDDNRLQLIIEDTGRGISRELLAWFMEDKALPPSSPQTGIGLVMIKELAPSVTDRIEMERLDPGTRVTLTFRAFSQDA
ncbi:MAG: histidine kinase [Dyadobacter sp.]|uniref:ligand-binding sensor domain-containing protein n=1 Tax=Dyadobacter sp. TaxID=1914288 RepID=UPI001B068BA3|nr:two-component regulator propeller domain-containing protein [Dyadobacter sp.]MBO9613370.1 histidine kinase [Dyadobacter sp.]